METPSFTFRLRRVRDLRERAEDHAREQLARELTNVHDPVQALEGGAKYLRRQLNRFGGDVARALAAYNAGPGAVERLGGVPPYAETQEYVRRVQANAAEFRATGSAGAASTARTAVLSTSPSIHGIV